MNISIEYSGGMIRTIHAHPTGSANLEVRHQDGAKTVVVALRQDETVNLFLEPVTFCEALASLPENIPGLADAIVFLAERMQNALPHTGMAVADESIY